MTCVACVLCTVQAYALEHAPAQWPVFVRDILAKNNMIKLEHSPYSPDRAPADFHLFERLNSALKG